VLAELTQKAQPEIVDEIAASDKAKADTKAKAEAKKAAEQEKANGNNGTVEQSPITPEIYLKALIDDDVPEQYAKLYIEFGNKYSVSPVLLAMQGRQESINFKPEVVDGRQHSPAGAMGISQFMEATWEAWKKKLGFPDEATPFQPRYAIEAQAALMKSNLSKATDMINKDPSITKLGISASGLALAGYNAGWGNIENHGVKKVATQWEETSKYIKIIKGNMAKIDKHIERLTPAKLEVKNVVDSDVLFDENGFCPAGTKSLGLIQVNKGEALLCAIDNLPSSGSTSTPGNKYFIKGAERVAVVSVEYAANLHAMVAHAKSLGVTLKAESSFRTIGEQRDLFCYNADCTKHGNPKYVAPPGASPHGIGISIDYDFDGQGTRSDRGCPIVQGVCASPKHPAWNYLHKYAKYFGFEQIRQESWHFNGKKDTIELSSFPDDMQQFIKNYLRELQPQ
jgi:soluble lytic murein transglycosylase-like protein